MIKGDLASEQKAVAPVAGTSELSALPEKAARALGEVLDGYFTIGDRLAGPKDFVQRVSRYQWHAITSMFTRGVAP